MTKDNYHTGRTERVARFLVSEGRPCTLAEIRAGIGADEESSKALHTMLQRLVRRGRATFTPFQGAGRGRGLYAATASTRYVRPAAQPRKSRAKPTAEQQPSTVRRDQPRPERRIIVGNSPDPQKAITREQLERDMAAFLAKGGQIEQLPNGWSAYDVAAPGVGHRAVNQASWNRRMAEQEAIEPVEVEVD